MKTPKLLALLALAGFCGATDSHARSNRFEIKHLERQRAERLEEHREAKERINELSPAATVASPAARADSAPRLSQFVTADIDDDSLDTVATDIVLSHSHGAIAHKGSSSNWQIKNPDLIRERELEASRMRDAAREIARLHTQIRKQKARERRIAERV